MHKIVIWQKYKFFKLKLNTKSSLISKQWLSEKPYLGGLLCVTSFYYYFDEYYQISIF